MYGHKFEKRTVGDDFRLLAPEVRKRIFSIPLATSTTNGKHELAVVEEFVLNHNVNVWINPSPIRADVQLPLQNSADFGVAYNSSSSTSLPVLVERDVKSGQVNRGNMAVSGHVHSRRFDSQKQRIFGVEEQKHASYREVKNRYELSFKKFEKETVGKKLLVKKNLNS